MTPGHPLFIETIRAFNEEELKYVIVGGVAVIAYGHNRTTGDVDIWVANDDENLAKLERAFLRLSFADEDVKAAVDSYRKGGKLTFYMDEESRMPVELMPIYAANISFEEAWEERNQLTSEGVTLNLVDIDTLIDMKIKAGRIQDLRDVKVLQELHNKKGGS
jgi:predicted nucleotidyltransferase